MSYTLHLWESPIPDSLDQAGQILSRLSAERCSQNPKFLALAQRLTARYPCLTTIGPDEETAWSDGPLDGRTDRPVYGIGLQGHAVAEALPFVAQVARENGLVMLDMQTGTVCRPDGRTLGASPMTAPAQPRTLSRDAVTQAVMARMIPTLQLLGFDASMQDRRFERRLPELTQLVEVFVESRTIGYALSAQFKVRPQLSAALMSAAAQSSATASLFLPRAAAGAGVSARRFDSMGAFDARIEDTAALEAVLVDLERVAGHAARVFADCSSLRVLHHLLNEVPLAESLFFHGNLHQFVAAMYGREVLEETHARLLAQAPDERHERLKRIRGLVLVAAFGQGPT